MNRLFVLFGVALALFACRPQTTPSLTTAELDRIVDTFPETPDMFFWDENALFDDSLQMAAVNRAVRVESDYRVLLLVLDNYCPMSIPDSVTPLERFEIARVQFDSLSRFDPGAYSPFIYAHFCQLLDRSFTQYMIRELRAHDSYSNREDSAWNAYFHSVSVAADSFATSTSWGSGFEEQEKVFLMMEANYKIREDWLRSRYEHQLQFE